MNGIGVYLLNLRAGIQADIHMTAAVAKSVTPKYLVRSAQDTAPRLLFPMYLFVLVLASLSLIVINLIFPQIVKFSAEQR